MISDLVKIFEKIIHERISNFLEESKIVSDKHFRFLINRGAKNALAYFPKYVYGRVDCHKKVLAAFIDLREAFDAVNHKILIEKLEKRGVRGMVFYLIRSYLTKQKARVKLGGVPSDDN